MIEFKIIDSDKKITGKHNLIGFMRPISLNQQLNMHDKYDLTFFNAKGEKLHIGVLKIGIIGSKESAQKFGNDFIKLSDQFFTFGQSLDYYTEIFKLSKSARTELLNSLNDIVSNEELYQQVLKLDENQSMISHTEISELVESVNQKLWGKNKSPAIEIVFTMNNPSDSKGSQNSLEFTIEPNSFPPTNVHALIGGNGTGKTRILYSMVASLFKSQDGEKYGKYFTNGHLELPFSKVIVVSFNAFDEFVDIYKAKNPIVDFTYVGLKRESSINENKDTNEIIEDFANSIALCFRYGYGEDWSELIEILNNDLIFADSRLNDYEKIETKSKKKQFIELEDLKKISISKFENLSSGHKMVLLTITKLVALVEENTLVLFDEPETHLHPPLLSAFIRSISKLLAKRNGLAILTTHSPLILQEIPKSCVWIVKRFGKISRFNRPRIETYCENVGALTREIFGFDATETGYFELLDLTVKKNENTGDIFEKLKHKIGSDGRAVLRGLIETK